MRAFVLPATLVLVLAGAGSAVGQSEPSPVPTSMPEGPPVTPPAASAPPASDDTEHVRKALAAVTYKDCGTGGPGKILVTFQTDGTVERVVLAEGTWNPAVAVCVTRRFMEATIPPFEGEPRTVKWSVTLAGGPPAATYAAPPGYGPPPGYAPYPYPRAEVIPADDGPPPAGYHAEDRPRTGSLISGSILSAMGLVFFLMSVKEEDSGYGSSDKSTFQLISIAHLAVGIPLFCVGLTKRKVFVANSGAVSLAPTVTRTGATFGLSVTF